MFIVTTKVSKRKAAAVFVGVCVLIAVCIIIVSVVKSGDADAVSMVDSPKDRGVLQKHQRRTATALRF